MRSWRRRRSTSAPPLSRRMTGCGSRCELQSAAAAPRARLMVANPIIITMPSSHAPHGRPAPLGPTTVGSGAFPSCGWPPCRGCWLTRVAGAAWLWSCVQVRRIDGEKAMASDGQFPEIFQLCRERVAQQRQTASAGSVGRAGLFG
jgi:hypothetical protein